MKYLGRLLIPLVLVMGLYLAAEYLPFLRPAYWQAQSNLQAVIVYKSVADHKEMKNSLNVQFSDASLTHDFNPRS